MGRFDPMATPTRMTGVCAKQTAGVDVERIQRIAAVDVAVGAESAPTGVALGRTGVRAIAVIPLRARSGHYRPKPTYANRADSDIASAISGISEVGANSSSAGASTAWASAGRPVDW